MSKPFAMNVFRNKQNELRSIWWVVIFFTVLATFTFPLVMLSRQYGWKVTLAHQAIVVFTATWIAQQLRRKPMSELFGKLNLDSIKNLLLGLVAGVLLMFLPALFMTAFGYIKWQHGNGDDSSILDSTLVFLYVAIAEEILFRGFVFQQLRKCAGLWTAQVLIAGYFLLTHMNNPGMIGDTKILAGINIFLASIMFGLAYLKTNSLIMPIAFHFMANWVQGTLLGFGVSGNEQASLLKPVFSNAPQWLNGGSFGLEAGAPGLVAVLAATVILYRWKPSLFTGTPVPKRSTKVNNRSRTVVPLDFINNQ